MKNSKWLRFLVGLVISLIVGIFYNPSLGFIMAVFVGFLKEMYDWLDGSNSELKNVADITLGGVLGFIVTVIINMVRC